ncbi:hypothetical protein [Bradyrhizobium sp. BR 1432]|uniref:hypothetical protein n=1 Tax=Bradyrhizobium sp. BR 1432 TaxID=3447966 RepID=UPI003EE5D646
MLELNLSCSLSGPSIVSTSNATGSIEEFLSFDGRSRAAISALEERAACSRLRTIER